MSQIQNLTPPGTIAPDIETITPDVGGAVGPDALLNLNLITGDGLTSSGNPGTNTITLSIDYHNLGTGQTVGAVTADIVTINLGAIATTYIFESKVCGFEATTPAGVGYNLICAARTTGAAATIIGVQDRYNAEDAALGACNAYFVAVGNTLVVRALGQAGLTVNWKATTDYVRVI